MKGEWARRREREAAHLSCDRRLQTWRSAQQDIRVGPKEGILAPVMLGAHTRLAGGSQVSLRLAVWPKLEALDLSEIDR